jgi:cobalt-zinc-cadmium efflux system protein
VYKLQGGNTLNERVLNWHLLEDVLGWVAVLIIAIVMQFVDWPILDPLLSIGFTLFILFNVIRNLLATLKLFLQGVPEKNLYKQVLDELRSVDRVEYIHDLKIWSLDGEHNVITIRVGSALKTVEEYKLLKLDIYDSLAMFDFSYSTVEIEFTDEHSAVNEEVR